MPLNRGLCKNSFKIIALNLAILDHVFKKSIFIHNQFQFVCLVHLSESDFYLSPECNKGQRSSANKIKIILNRLTLFFNKVMQGKNFIDSNETKMFYT